MKFKHLLFGFLAAGMVLVGCDPKQNEGTPRVDIQGVDNGVLTFDKGDGTKTITMRANRDWSVSFNPATANEWINMQTEGKATDEDGITLPISVAANTGFSREATVTFRARTVKKTIKIRQEGEGGSEDDATVYFNNFDKEAATQTFGSSSNSWPYLDQSECWKNEKGTGAANVAYAFSGMSARNNSNSNGSYSDYKSASGVNNLLFGKENYFAVKNIALEAATNYTLSFVGVRNEYGKEDNVFSAEEFKVYVSDQAELGAERWVELTYSFANGTPNGRWDLAASTFTVPAGTESLSIYISTSLASSYRLDDLKLMESAAAGTTLDFTKGVKVGESTGGDVQGTPEGEGTEASPYNATKAIQVASALASGAQTTEKVYVKGIVTGFKNVTGIAQYGNIDFWISDDGKKETGEFLVFQCLYLNGEKFTSADQLKIGDEVVIYANLTNYMGNTPETVGKGNASIISINGSAEAADYFSVSTTTISKAAVDMSATFKVSASESVAWTASVTEGADFVKILSGESGTGNGDVVLELTQNETEIARVAKVTVSTTADVAEKNLVVTLTQKAKVEGGEGGDGKALTIVLDPSTAGDNLCDGFPNTTAGAKGPDTYTIDGYEYTFYAPDKYAYYPNDKYVLFGKKGGYVLLPSVQGKKLVKVSILTGKGASVSVQVGVYSEDGNNIIHEPKVLSAKDTTFDYELSGTEINEKYRFQIASTHNAQFQKLTLYYE